MDINKWSNYLKMLLIPMTDDLKLDKIERDPWNVLKKESTISLIRRIAEDSDTLALRVFHETRTLFYRNGKWVRLAEFVIALRDSNFRGQEKDESSRIYMSNATDEAYDLTLAKFHNIPSNDTTGFTWGVDCRLYFKQLLGRINKELSKIPANSESDIEGKVATIVTRFVIRHFHLSMKECKRRDTISIRYPWEVGGRIIYLFYPSHLTAKQFRKWLEDNITDVNPDDPHEKKRIQDMINQKYTRRVIIQDDDPEISKELGKRDNNWLELKEGNQFSDGFCVHIAKEKSENLEELRPAIKSLGKEGVYNLVNRIFTDMKDEQYNLSEVARMFNLSKATLSRFAGSDWIKDEDMEQLSKADIPDLWINTARVLAKNPEFMEVVMNTGFKDFIDKILEIIEPQEGQKND